MSENRKKGKGRPYRKKSTEKAGKKRGFKKSCLRSLV